MTLRADLTRLFDDEYRLNARETERLARDALHNHRDQLDYHNAPHTGVTPTPPPTTERIMDSLKLAELQQLRAEVPNLREVVEAAVDLWSAQRYEMDTTEAEASLATAVQAYLISVGRAPKALLDEEYETGDNR